MAIVSGTKFITYNPNLDLQERRSTGPNDKTRVYTIEDIVAEAAGTEVITLAASDETTVLTTGTKMTFRMPYAMTVTEVRASLTTAPTTSGLFTVDINDGGTSILSTKLSIDLTETTSTTAAVPAVISDSLLADDAEITVDIDIVSGGLSEAGLKVTLIGNLT
jgi:hypothetical protein